MRLTGIFAALTTPFGDDGELQLDRLAANLERYNATRLSGYLVLGSSGEAVYLSREEKIAVLRRAREKAAPGKLLLAGTAEESLRGTLEMTERAAEMGCSAAVVRTPHYYKKAMTPQALLRFYRDLAEHSPLPLVLYNIPPLTGVDLNLETILALATHPNIVGLKESSGNMDKLIRLAAANTKLALLVGGASTVYPSLCAGASGAILALAAAAPDACCELERAFQRGDHAAAQAQQRALLPACAAFEPFSIAGLKAAVDAAGLFGGPPRLPQIPVTDQQRERIVIAMESLVPARATAQP